jgi:hypothetical protein
MADRPLGEPERRDEVTDAGLSLGLGLDEAEEPKACRVGEDLEHAGQLAGLGRLESLLE